MDIVWKVVLRGRSDEPDLATGWALCASAEIAQALCGYPDAKVIAQPHKVWPGTPERRFQWTNAPKRSVPAT